MTVSDDGGVPVYFTTDDGDKHDDQRHVSTWNLLRQLTGRPAFLYIADCKLASRENLAHIDREGGRFITILPKNRSEPRKMKQMLPLALKRSTRPSTSLMRDRHRVESEVEKILARRTMEEFVRVEVLQEEEEQLKQETPGRPNEKT